MKKGNSASFTPRIGEQVLTKIENHESHGLATPYILHRYARCPNNLARDASTIWFIDEHNKITLVEDFRKSYNCRYLETEEEINEYTWNKLSAKVFQ